MQLTSSLRQGNHLQWAYPGKHVSNVEFAQGESLFLAVKMKIGHVDHAGPRVQTATLKLTAQEETRPQQISVGNLILPVA